MTVFVGCPEGCRYHTASAVYDLVHFYIIEVSDHYNAIMNTATVTVITVDLQIQSRACLRDLSYPWLYNPSTAEDIATSRNIALDLQFEGQPLHLQY